MSFSELARVIENLPDNLQKEVLDFASFLYEKQPKVKNSRVAGLHEGQVWMSDDFDDPLPDSFWLGED